MLIHIFFIFQSPSICSYFWIVIQLLLQATRFFSCTFLSILSVHSFKINSARYPPCFFSPAADAAAYFIKAVFLPTHRE